jgi:ABC-type transport system involved in cytochrome bd biosynthesis fused ATPase/permease subunit
MLEMQEAFAGLMPFIWHIGITSTLVILCGIVVWLSASLRVKLIFLVAALLLVTEIVSYLVGAHNEHERCAAQEAAVQSEVTAVVQAAPAKVKPHHSLLHPFGGVRYDKWDRDWKN